MPPTFQLLASLDDLLPPGAESQLLEARQRNLLDGVAIGILLDGQHYLRLAGRAVVPDSQFEIASVTKTYTAELLAILAQRGAVQLDDPIAKYLPRDVARDSGPHPITLLDLATHRSGLPRLPSNMGKVDPRDPYAAYGNAELENYLREATLQRPQEPQFLYSNLGYMVLGFVLSRAAGTSYAELLQREILAPQALDRTLLATPGRKILGLLPGSMPAGLPAPHWTSTAAAPAGGLCSTAGDQLRWLGHLLADPERTSLQPHAQAGHLQIGLGWMIRPGGDSCWHNGGTGGFSSYVALHRRMRYAVVVLANRHAAEPVTALGTALERSLRVHPACLSSPAPENRGPA